MSTTTAWDAATAAEAEATSTVKLPVQGKIRTYGGGAPALTLRGRAGTAPDLTFLPSGARVCRFRMAVTQRGRDDAGVWHDVATTWYTVKAWNNLAENIAHSILKGQPVLVTGRLDVNQWENKETGQRGTEVSIIATSAGHDLTYGTARYHKLTNDGYEQATGQVDASDQPVQGEATPRNLEQKSSQMSAEATAATNRTSSSAPAREESEDVKAPPF
ncbi:MAG: single-stranded DNA-binding protein [Actinomycetaceae bacterium]|nr:single-stranded DNA-binding protein [Actinomycetaceae bacterium]